MSRLRVFASRASSHFRGRAADADLREQIEAHLEEATEELVSQGMALDDARRAARLAFGSVTHAREASRDVRSFGWIEDATRDVAFAFRSLKRAPTVALVVVATIALASGVATALFSVIDAAVLRPLPYERPEDIVAIDVGTSADQRISPSADDVEQLRHATSLISAVGMGRLSGFAPVVVDAGTPERVVVGTATEGLLEVFGVTPIIGRPLGAADRLPGAQAVVLVGHAFWQTRLQGAADVVGRTIRVDGTFATIVGVLPPDFHAHTMVWRPYVASSVMQGRRGSGVPVYARLRPGVPLAAAASALAGRLSPAGAEAPAALWLTPLYDQHTARHRRTVVLISGTIVSIVLIASVNVALLLLGRGGARRAEMAVRWSLGASRGRLARQLLTEAGLLALLGGLVGAGLAFVTLDAVLAGLPLELDDDVALTFSPRVIVFALVCPALTAFAAGLAPALALSRTVAAGMAAGRLHVRSMLTRRSGHVLVAAEVAMTMVLLVGALLLVKSFSRIVSIDVGFNPDAFTTMFVLPLDETGGVDEQAYRTLLDRVRRIPGVAAAGGADRPPLDGSGSYTTAKSPTASAMVSIRTVTAGYFEAVGLRVQRGRLPEDRDHQDTPRFAVLSESAARRLFADDHAVGQTLALADKTWTVLGVVNDARSSHPLRHDARPDVYLAREEGSSSSFGPGFTLIVRPAARGVPLTSQLESAARSIGTSVIVERTRTGRDWFDEQVAHPRHVAVMLSVVGALAWLLTVVGVFATTTFAVTSRTREAGIRMALGARAADVVRSLVMDSQRPVVVGILVGAVGAALLTRVIEGLLYDTTAHDPSVFGAVAAGSVVTALVAAWLPATRVARIDPVAALRLEER